MSSKDFVIATIAKLLVSLGLDSSEFSSGLDQAEHKARGVSGVITGVLGGIGVAIASIATEGLAQGFDLVYDSAIGMNAELEKSTLQFTTLMGNADQASDHVKGLFDFAAKTPFESGPIIEASRIMETFGGKALDTTENLTLFGDAAAGTSAPINEVSFWMSRAYAAIQGGQPFGEARMRLMELGILSPQVANKLEKLSASGADSSLVWNELTQSLHRFDGAMLLQANTWEGLTSSIKDNVSILLANAFKPIFEVAKTGLSSVLVWLDRLAQNGALDRFAANLASAIQTLIYLPSTVMPYVNKGLELFNSLLQIDVISNYVGYLRSWADLILKVGSKLSSGDFKGALEALFSGSINVANAAKNFYTSLGKLIARGVTYITENAPKWGKAFLDWVTPYIPQLLTKLNEITTNIQTWVTQQVPILSTSFTAWSSPFSTWVNDAWNNAVNSLGNFINNFVTWISAQVPLLWGAFAAWANNLWTWVPSATIKFLQAWPDMLESFLDWIAEAATPILKQLGLWAISFVEWIVPNIPNILVALGGIILAIGIWIVETAIVITAKVIEWAWAMLMWIDKELIPRLPGMLAKFYKSIIDWIIDAVGLISPEAAKLGHAFVNGMWQGIQDMWENFKRGLLVMINDLPVPIQMALGIGSYDTSGKTSLPGINGQPDIINPSVGAMQGAMSGSSTVNLNVDGRQMAQVVIPHVGDAMQAGVNNALMAHGIQ